MPFVYILRCNLVDGTLYISGMAGEDAAGKIPARFEAGSSPWTASMPCSKKPG
jgi:hypothetical protein